MEDSYGFDRGKRRWRSEEDRKLEDNYRHKRQQGDINNIELITLFVDNIPNKANLSWLIKTFTNYGIVKGAFIPAKKSIRNTKFGFVRYDCSAAAGVAIFRADDMMVDNYKLRVKYATFNKESSFKQSTTYGKNSGNDSREDTSFVSKGKSYAQAVNNNPAVSVAKQQPYKSIKIQSSGNGWLFRSAIATLRRRRSMEELRKDFTKENFPITDVRSMGGRFTLLTFSNCESRDELIKSDGFQLWFDSIKPWNGEVAGIERFAWLSCTGIPLHAWGVQNFKKIGEIWGHFMEVDEDTMKFLSFEKGRILIATSFPQKIIDKLQLDIDNFSYLVSIIEEDDPLQTTSSSVTSSSLQLKVRDDDPTVTRLCLANTSWPPKFDSAFNAMMEDFLNLHGECKGPVHGEYKGCAISLSPKTATPNSIISKEGLQVLGK
ncbi:hypothetical protein Vadar_028489 [Vaccinium darrowii]|uniref:Uncharacterized protein n=1 Tax=Vaccinium darrowii TaxID=229202 RepID=A0ACB7XKF5_9ERIC|nr:hypothetical protein Vadar_028489 [Vaccinium darrowii]